MGGGAWPFLVGGVICLLNCDNERDLCQLLDAAFVFKFACDQGLHRLLVTRG